MSVIRSGIGLYKTGFKIFATLVRKDYSLFKTLCLTHLTPYWVLTDLM